MTYALTVRQVQQTCLFELTWGRGRRLNAELPYLPQLESLYDRWQQAYLNFYRQELRGRVGVAGQVTSPTVDRHSRLVEAEALLLSEFHRWLRHEQLFKIRQVLGSVPQSDAPDILLSCNSLFLARLPWETWELKAGGGHCRIARVSHTVQQEVSQVLRPRRGKPRVLLVLGDDTGLNFGGDLQAFEALKSFVQIEAVGWEPGKDTRLLKQDICQKIAAPQGWDILFFAGHSNESEVVDGNLAIAPNTALSIRELAPYLQKAQAQGLKFALFNSCSGLTIADALVEMGLSQVAIMREPIHNEVAQQFLVPFLQGLVQGEDVQDAIASACRHLKSAQNLTYPSAYLVPSLFRHPEAVPFRLQRTDWRYHLQRWLPNRRQGVALAAVAVLSVIPAVRETFLSGRLLSQAIYRNLTGQLPQASPEVVLVQVDNSSVQQSILLENPVPINQQYLSTLLDKLVALDAQVIGIDFLLDRQSAEGPILAATLEQSVEKANTWFIFASHWRNGREQGVNSAQPLTNFNWSMQGYTDAPKWYGVLPWSPEACKQISCPFAYLLAVAARYQQSTPAVGPEVERTQDLKTALFQTLSAMPPEQGNLGWLVEQQTLPITLWSDRWQQRWLRPFLDFSLPPDQVFRRVSAHTVLADPNETATTIRQATVVLVGPVAYAEAQGDGWSENHPLPPAVAYWRQQNRDPGSDEAIFAGVESIAYELHQLLVQHQVAMVPSLWLVGVALFVGKGLVLLGYGQSQRRGANVAWLLIGSGVYGLVGLQSTINTSLLLPWLLPTATVWIYLLPAIWSPTHD
ncbi:MAG: CHASE2 domain-containing protein [Leptolyngbyaceae cyanobacterium]